MRRFVPFLVSVVLMAGTGGAVSASQEQCSISVSPRVGGPDDASSSAVAVFRRGPSRSPFTSCSRSATRGPDAWEPSSSSTWPPAPRGST